MAEGEDERDVRAVNKQAGRALVDSALKEIAGFEPAPRCVEHRKDRADGDVGVNVGGAVQRVDRDQKGSGAVEVDGRFALLRNDAANTGAAQSTHERVVSKNVERFLGHTVVGRTDLGVEGARERAVANAIGHNDGGVGQRGQHPRHVRRGVDGEE